MAKQSKKQTKDSSKKEDSKKTDTTSVVQNSLASGTPLSVEELSAVVKQDHEKIEEIHKYLKHLRWLSGIRLAITLALIIVPVIIAAVAIPPLLRQVEGVLEDSGLVNEQGVFDPGSAFEQMVGDQLDVFPGGGSGEYEGNLTQPPADFDSWSQEQQEEWVRTQFDG